MPESGDYSADQLQAWTDSLTDGDITPHLSEHFYFAETGHQIVGYGKIDLHGERIDTVLVDPAFFRRGIGSEIMRELEHIAQTHGLQHLVLDSTLNAVPFYRSLGFEGESVSIYASPRGLSLQCVSKAKRLKPV